MCDIWSRNYPEYIYLLLTIPIYHSPNKSCMKISIEKKTITEAVHIVSRFVERRSGTLPVLSSILIIAGDEGIKLRATNLEIGIDFKIEGTIHQPGVVAIPAAILQQITSTLTIEGVLTLEQKGDSILLTSGTSKSTIKTSPSDDFPTIPFPENPKNRFILPGNTLKQLFTTIAACASTSSVRPELASIYVSIEGGILTAVATDSFRLVEKKIPLTNKGTQGKVLIPAKNAIDIAQALPDEEIILSFDEHQCALVSPHSMIVSRLTNAVYPDYRQIIPKESITEAVVLKKDFELALKRMQIFSDTFQKVRMSFHPDTHTLSFFAKNADIGESTEEITSRGSGSSLELSFNHRYLSTVLPLTHMESLSLVAAGIGRPLIITGVGDTSLLCLVSPMNQ